MPHNSRIRTALSDASALAVGALLFAISLDMFLLPSKTVLGGLTGIATVLNLFFSFPIGITTMLLNIPLILLNARGSGRRFLFRTGIGIAATSVAADLPAAFPVTVTDPLLCALLGGASMGASLGILLSRGFTTGGTDLVAALVRRKYPQFSTGSVIMAADFVIITGAAMLTGEVSGLFYSVLCTMTAGFITDYLLSGAKRGAQAFIISDDAERITDAVLHQMQRGVTVIYASGGYTGEGKTLLMCVVPKRELYRLKELVRGIDPDAFIAVADVVEVDGEGFPKTAA